MEPESKSGSRAALWLAIALCGPGVGLVSSAFHLALDRALALREALGAALAPYGAPGLALLMGMCAGAVSLAVWLTERFAPRAAGSGIQHVEAVERGLAERWPFAVGWVKFVGGVLGIGGGLVLGREGPTVQMGAQLADALGARLRVAGADRNRLLAIGAGAGLAGAFNAPLAGVIFVAEELAVPLRPVVYLGGLVAALFTDLCCRFLVGSSAELPIQGALPETTGMLVPVLLVGALAGALGASFNATTLQALDATRRLRALVPRWLPGAALGALLGAVAWVEPGLPGGGVGYAARVLAGEVAPETVVPLLVASFALTVASYASGAPGGVFAPLLVIGALLGQGLSQAFALWAPGFEIEPALLAAAGMAGLFAAIVRAPLTGIVLLLEMTDRGELVLPLIGASLVAHGVANALGSSPLYESLLRRELASRSE